MEEFRLAAGLAAAIINHARAGYPAEVCGLIAGRAGQGLEIHPGRNIAADPLTRFEMDPLTLAGQVAFEDQGLRLAAIYHSHPHGPAGPSPTDVEGATYPDAVYIICDLSALEPALRAFRIRGGRAWEIGLHEVSSIT